jgi:hypothetical protein
LDKYSKAFSESKKVSKWKCFHCKLDSFSLNSDEINELQRILKEKELLDPLLMKEERESLCKSLLQVREENPYFQPAPRDSQ